jgi:thioredoxin-related protein
MQCAQAVADMLGLPHGKGTFTGSDGQGLHGGKNGLFDLAKDDATLTAMMYPHSPEGTTTMMRLIAAWALILACGMTLPAAARAAEGLVHAKNFQADARTAAQRGAPILVIFTSPTCPYCERIKREYLGPMHQDPAYRSRVIIREVTAASTTPLVGFDGKPTTEGAFAAANQVFMVPTVKIFDTHGAEASEAIVGLLTPDYYLGYLEAAIDEGVHKVRGK